MLVEGFERSDESSRVLQNNPHPIVQELDHFVVLADRLEDDFVDIVINVWKRMEMFVSLPQVG